MDEQIAWNPLPQDDHQTQPGQPEGIITDPTALPDELPFGTPIPVPVVDPSDMRPEEGNQMFVTLEQGTQSERFMPALQSLLSGQSGNKRVIASWHQSGVWGWSDSNSSEHDKIKRKILAKAGEPEASPYKTSFVDMQLHDPIHDSAKTPSLSIVHRGADASAATFDGVLKFLVSGGAELDNVTAWVRFYGPGGSFEYTGKLSDAQAAYAQRLQSDSLAAA